MDAYVAAIEDGFEELKIGSDAILIGNGFGGTVALAFAFAHPERIEKLVVSDAAAGFPPEGRQAFAADGGESCRRRARRRRRDRRQAGVFAGLSCRAPEAIEERKAVLMGIEPKAFQAACKILQETDLTPELHKVQVPTLVICGEFDQATPPALSKQWPRRSPARATSSCPAAAIARRWSSRSSFSPRSRISSDCDCVSRAQCSVSEANGALQNRDRSSAWSVVRIPDLRRTAISAFTRVFDALWRCIVRDKTVAHGARRRYW